MLTGGTGPASAPTVESWMVRWDRHAERLLIDRPGTCVAGTLVLAAMLGVAAPVFGHSAFMRDLVEGFLWGRSLELGYHKHPPLQAWVLGAIERVVTDGDRWLVFVVAQACVAGAVIPVWLLSRALAGPVIGALSAMFTLAGIHFYTSPTQTLTPDTLSLPFWSLTLWFYWRAVGEGRDRAWYGLAVAAVGFVYAKYVGLLLLAVLIVLTLATPEGRASLRRPAPWLAATIAAFLCLPHAIWLVQASGAPVHYVVDRFGAADLPERLRHGGLFLLNQLLNHGGLLILVALGTLRLPLRPTRDTTIPRPGLTPFARKFLLTVAVAPTLLAVITIFLSGVYFRPGSASPFYALSALAILLLAGRELRLRNLATVLPAVLVLVAVQHVAAGFGPRLLARGEPVTYPARAIAQELTQRFRAATGRPLAYVVGERWHAGNAAFYSPDRPLLTFDGEVAISPGVTAQAVHDAGALLVWDARMGHRMPASVGGGYAGAPEQGTIERPWANKSGQPLLRLHYAIVPPDNRTVAGVVLRAPAASSPR